MSEYWLISAPGDKTCQQTWETMNNITNKQNNLSVNYKFPIPDLKVGTLDQLVGLSDDLGKLDTFVDQVTRKVASYLGEVLEDQRDKLHENLMANNNCSIDESDDAGEDVQNVARRCSCATTTNHTSCPLRSPNNNNTNINTNNNTEYNTATSASASASLASSPISSCCSGGHESPTDQHATSTRRSRSSRSSRVGGDGDSDNNELTDICSSHDHPPILAPGDLPSYITRFQWDMAKYPIKQSLRNIADIISKQVGQIDADLKTKSTAYNNLKGNLQNLEKKQTGSLLTRNLADLVKKEYFILDSEYLTTLLVIVPKPLFHEWENSYEKLTDMIVPRSSTLISQDQDYGLFTVSLFKKVVDEFKLHAREKKFIVRDFTYNEEELAAGKNEITKLVTDKKKQFGPLVRWLKVNFSECFCAWVHVKALRVFVESVLRYGLPVNFQAILIHPNKKCHKKLRDVLNQLYGHLDSSALQSSGHHDSVDIPGLGFGQSEYYPYVYYKLNIDMVD